VTRTARREITQAELAEILAITTRQVRNLEAQGLPHRADKNRKLYPIPDAVDWIRKRDVEAAVSAMQSTEFDEAKRREMVARAEKAELEVAKIRGELIHIDDWEALYSRPLAQLRARLLALPGRIAAELPMPAVEAVEIIEPIVHGFMEELSEMDDDEPGAAA